MATLLMTTSIPTLTFDMASLRTKFEDSGFTRSENRKSDFSDVGWLGSLKIIGNVIKCHQMSSMDRVYVTSYRPFIYYMPAVF